MTAKGHSTDPLESHKRVNEGLLMPLERPTLAWLVKRLPQWTTPDLLTAVGALGALMSGTGYALSRLSAAWLLLASAGLVVNWFGDSLDGTLARYRGIERPRYGFFIDHTTDAVCVLVVFVGIGLSPFVRLDVALLLLAVYLMLEVLSIATVAVTGVFRISYGIVGATEARVLAIFGNGLFLCGINPTIFRALAEDFSLADVIIVVIAALLLLLFAVHARKTAQRVLATEKQC